MTIDRVLINIVSDDLSETAGFYEKLLGFKRVYESDWFFDLTHPDTPLEIGIIKRGHEIVPEGANGKPGGCYLTFVVKDIEETAGLAKSLGARIVEEPADTFYGQRRMLLLDPQDNSLDISSPQNQA